MYNGCGKNHHHYPGSRGGERIWQTGFKKEQTQVAATTVDKPLLAALDGCADRVNLNAVLFVEVLASALLEAGAANATALANLGDGLLDRNTRCSAHNFLALKLVVLLLPAIQTAAHERECALDATDESAEAKDDGCALDYKTKPR